MIATVRVHISLLLCACVAACGDDDGSGDSMGESGGTTAGGTTSSTGSDATSEAPTSDPIPGTSTGSDTGTETGTDTSTGADGSTGGMDYGEYEACASYGATLAECFHEGDPAEAAVAEGVCNDYIGYHFMSPDGAPACAAAFEALAACIGGSSCKELVGRRACPTETEVAEEACPNLPNP
jgi:hypothetical protein